MTRRRVRRTAITATHDDASPTTYGVWCVDFQKLLGDRTVPLLCGLCADALSVRGIAVPVAVAVDVVPDNALAVATTVPSLHVPQRRVVIAASS